MLLQQIKRNDVGLYSEIVFIPMFDVSRVINVTNFEGLASKFLSVNNEWRILKYEFILRKDP